MKNENHIKVFITNFLSLFFACAYVFAQTNPTPQNPAQLQASNQALIAQAKAIRTMEDYHNFLKPLQKDVKSYYAKVNKRRQAFVEKGKPNPADITEEEMWYILPSTPQKVANCYVREVRLSNPNQQDELDETWCNGQLWIWAKRKKKNDKDFSDFCRSDFAKLWDAGIPLEKMDGIVSQHDLSKGLLGKPIKEELKDLVIQFIDVDKLQDTYKCFVFDIKFVQEGFSFKSDYNVKVWIDALTGLVRKEEFTTFYTSTDFKYSTTEVNETVNLVINPPDIQNINFTMTPPAWQKIRMDTSDYIEYWLSTPAEGQVAQWCIIPVKEYYEANKKYPETLTKTKTGFNFERKRALVCDPYRPGELPVYKCSSSNFNQSFILYSVGPNKIDDGGAGDDIVWRGESGRIISPVQKRMMK